MGTMDLCQFIDLYHLVPVSDFDLGRWSQGMFNSSFPGGCDEWFKHQDLLH